MRRITTVLATVVLLVGAVGATPAASLAQSDGTTTPTDGGATPTASGGTNVSSGGLLSGTVAVQAAELDGELRGRTFGLRVARAASNESKADVVADQLAENRERLEELEERKETLKQARENGTISESQYRVRMAELAAETENVERLTNRSANASAGLPSDLLAERGINVTAIRTLSERANELTGPEVSRMARSIAGPSFAGRAPDRAADRRGPPGNESDRRGPPGNESDRRGPPGNESDRRGPPEDGGGAEQGDGATNQTTGGDGADGAEPGPGPGPDGDGDADGSEGAGDGADRSGGDRGAGGG